MDVPWCARNISSKQEETEFTIQISNINEIKFYLYNANRETSVCIQRAKKKQKKKEFEEKEIKNPLFNKIKKMRKISSQIVLLRWN